MRFIKLAFFFMHVVSATDATSCVSDSVGEPVCDTEQDRTTLLQNRLLVEEKETKEAALEDEEIVIQSIKEPETFGAEPEGDQIHIQSNEETETYGAALEDEEIEEPETYEADPEGDQIHIQSNEEKETYEAGREGKETLIQNSKDLWNTPLTRETGQACGKTWRCSSRKLPCTKWTTELKTCSKRVGTTKCNKKKKKCECTGKAVFFDGKKCRRFKKQIISDANKKPK